jgi:Helix-turn-helix domain
VGDRLPVMLTVEEAGALLRIGRTKAYAMAREWRATGGRSGLPVIDLGHVLRVPRRALEEMLGSDLTGEGGQVDGSGAPGERRPPAPARPGPESSRSPTRARASRIRHPGQPDGSRQLNLISDPDAPAS